jgi:hypothetical protein
MRTDDLKWDGDVRFERGGDGTARDRTRTDSYR